METIIKTIPVNDASRLYVVCNSNRYFLARCEMKIIVM